MKILHTADWHLGKKLCGICRLDEQRAVLSEIIDIAKAEKADVTVISGDVFDTAVPSAMAEQLFYETAVALSRSSVVIALAGNHDDPDRLSAAKDLAKSFNIFLSGNQSTSSERDGVTSGDGFVKVERGGQRLNLAVLPYPQLSNLSESENKDLSYGQIVAKKLDCICKTVFSEDGFNVVLSHLFMIGSGGDKAALGSDGTEMKLEDERELGGAAILPLSVLPSNSDLTLLGHIHKPMTVSKSRRVFYSGSILPYSFDDVTAEKSVLIATLDKNDKGLKNVQIERKPLAKGRKLLKKEAASFLECDKVLSDNADAYVHLIYCGNEPLKLSELAALKKQSSFCKIENTFLADSPLSSKEKNSSKSAAELFSAFYKKTYKTEKEPPEELLQMFLDVLNER